MLNKTPSLLSPSPPAVQKPRRLLKQAHFRPPAICNIFGWKNVNRQWIHEWKLRHSQALVIIAGHCHLDLNLASVQVVCKWLRKSVATQVTGCWWVSADFILHSSSNILRSGCVFITMKGQATRWKWCQKFNMMFNQDFLS